MNWKFFKRELDKKEKSYYSSHIMLGNGIIIYGLSRLSTKTIFISLVNCETEEKIKEMVTHETLHIVLGKDALPCNVDFLEGVIYSLCKKDV